MVARREPYEFPAIRAFAAELAAWRGTMSKVELAETLGYTPQLIGHDERALRWMIGGRNVMRDQLQHLLKMSERPNIMIEVIPQETTGHAGPGNCFTLLSFDMGRISATRKPSVADISWKIKPMFPSSR